MAVPSVMKIKKGNVEFTGKADLAKYTIEQLTRRAMMDVGRYMIYLTRTNVKKAFPFVKAKKNANRYQYWVPKKENCCVLGIENRKRGAVTAWWADQLEQDSFVGQKSARKSASSPRRHIMERTVKSSLNKIVEIESQYLRKIGSESAAVALAQATEAMEALRGDEE